MSLCPNGHDSAATDYCDTCGILMGTPAGGGVGAGGAAGGGASSAAGTSAAGAAAGSVAPEVAAGDCSNCGAAKVAGERFCEVCGLDFETGRLPQAPQATAAGAVSVDPSIGAAVPLPPGIGWTAVLSCDRDWWQHNTGAGGVADGVPYPDPEPAPRRVELRSNTNVIGRTSGSSVADVDCGGADTGVSRKHARISLGADGAWTVTDLGSTNGTFVGADNTKLNPQAETPFDPATPIKIGAYTVVRLEADPPVS